MRGESSGMRRRAVHLRHGLVLVAGLGGDDEAVGTGATGAAGPGSGFDAAGTPITTCLARARSILWSIASSVPPSFEPTHCAPALRSPKRTIAAATQPKVFFR